ncbi:MAG: hypothetical protein U0414_19500 [Polyangiaceae bacterium]
MKALAIEESAAEILLALADVPEQLFSYVPQQLPRQMRLVAVGTACYVLGPKATADASLLVFPLSKQGFFDGVPQGLRSAVLQRCLRAGMTSQRPGQSLPRSWAPYHGPNSLLLFYTTTIAAGHAGMSTRAIVQSSAQGSSHVLVCELILGGTAPNLEDYAVPPAALEALLEVVGTLNAAVEATVPPSSLAAIESHDFHVPSPFQAPTHGRTLREWMQLLTDEQSDFLARELDGPIKIRGAAGTGKTLAIMLKAVHELYVAHERSRPWNGIIFTHNWTTTEAIRAALVSIDERKLLSAGGSLLSLSVQTLQEFAELKLGLRGDPLAKPISEDSHEGKMMQLEVIGSLVAEFVRSDWAAFRGRCSDVFARRITSPIGTPTSRLLCWDLMSEFACVISASRSTSRDRYITMSRQRWMMALPNAADREVAFLLHEEFRRFMHEGLGTLTTYDIVNDLLRHLDTNVWHLRRRSEGFDAVFVDEFHLFNKQEMLVFQHLSRDPFRPASAVLALDPRQSPAESFLGFKVEAHHPIKKVFDEPVRNVLFHKVFRYTKEINAVLENLERHWFGYELSDEYEFAGRSADTEGPTPTTSLVADLSTAFDRAIRLAREHVKAKRSAAVLVLGHDAFQAMRQRVRVLDKERECVFVESRDAAESLASLGSRYVVSQPEYLAGSQFDAVIVVDANHSLVRAGADEQLEDRRTLSALYLGISRARRYVDVLAASSEGGLVKFLRPAVSDGHLVEVD